MKKQAVNNVKLGIFILAGLLVLVISLYIIGQNQNFFGSGFLLKARFTNVNGLMPGNNVRFSGIQCGTVKDIEIINDTTIEIELLINSKTSVYIRANASAGIGTEGLMGNKVVNIFPGDAGAPPIQNGGMLKTAKQNGIDDMMSSLSATGNNALDISANLKETTIRINNSPLLRQLLQDTTLAANLHRSLANFENASSKLDKAVSTVNMVIDDVQRGKGMAGLLLENQQAASDLAETLGNIKTASTRINGVLVNLDSLVRQVRADAGNGKGAVHMLLRDTLVTKRFDNSLQNIEKGTAAFHEDMEALKHNILLRGYFKKQAKKNKK